jgi:aconitate hydratase
MKLNLTQKILKDHLVEGKMITGEPIEIKIDQTLTQDATGTMAYLQFESMGLSKVQTELSVSYVDHNTLQSGFENPDDHAYLRTIAAKYGIIFSKPGNGICHQLHLERFAKPGKTLLGSDSHTPTCGGMAMISIGAGGLDVAIAMGGGPFQLNTPKVCKVNLTGKLRPWVTAKDVILEILRRETVKGGVGKVYEYDGPGLKTLSVPERATITNMGAELGATTSIFPSDEITGAFMKAQEREKDWVELKADEGAEYDQVIEINLSELEPMVACPHSPGNVKKLSEIKGIKVDQIAIGSCTNSSYNDMKTVAEVLKGKKVHSSVDLGICFGSRQVATMLSVEGSLTDIIQAGARILESVCGPCIGMGFSPKSNGVCLRTFNRNFFGRTGTKTADVYLVSPEVAVAAAIRGEITDPSELGTYPEVKMPEKFIIDDSMFLYPVENPGEIEITRGPNIAPCPAAGEMPENIEGEILIKVGDDITTDHIMPAGAKILPLRSNVPKISEHVFEVIDENFHKRAKEKNGGMILGGDNYGQGSSREHAALAPMYLGVRAVMVKSFARIHLANLINFGILPLTFVKPEDYDRIGQGDRLLIENAKEQIRAGEIVKVKNVTGNFEFEMKHPVKGKSADILISGGQLNYTKKKLGK